MPATEDKKKLEQEQLTEDTTIEVARQDERLSDKDGQIFDLHLGKDELDDTEREVLAQKICAEIGDILKDPEYMDKMQEFEENTKAYKGAVPDAASAILGGSNTSLFLEARHVDRARPRVKQALKMKPTWMVDPTEKSDVKSITKVENLLDYTSVREMEWPKLQHCVINDCFKLGTGIVKETYLKKRETVWDIEEYDSLQKFDKKYGKDGMEKYPKFREQIRNLAPGADPIKFIVTRPEITYDAPVVERVPPDRFVSSLGERDLNKCRLVGHSFDLNWDDIIEREDRKDSTRFDDTEKLKRRFDQDGNTLEYPDYDKETQEFYEVIYRYRDRKGRQRKGVFTVGYEARAIVQASRFPYLHNRCYFIPFYTDPDENSFWGNAVVSKLKQLSRSLKKVIDNLINAAIVSNQPSFVQSSAGGMRGHRGRFYSGKIYSAPNPNTDVKQLTIKGADPLLLKIASYLEETADIITGIPRGMSGQTLATDPSAPGNKTIALLQEANINVGEFTDNFQIGNAEVGLQTGMNIWQHMGPKKEFKILGEGDRTIPSVITRAEARAFKANYLPHGNTDISNKALQNQIAMLVLNVLTQSQIVQKQVANGNMEPLRIMYKTFLETVGGEWDKRIHQILPSPEETEEEYQAMNDESHKRLVQEEQDKIMQEMNQMGGQGQQPQMMPQQQGQPMQAQPMQPQPIVPEGFSL